MDFMLTCTSLLLPFQLYLAIALGSTNVSTVASVWTLTRLGGRYGSQLQSRPPDSTWPSNLANFAPKTIDAIHGRLLAWCAAVVAQPPSVVDFLLALSMKIGSKLLASSNS